MTIAIANVMSAIGDTNSFYPLLVRDCGIENVAKCYLTYQENKKESNGCAKLALRERFLQEYSNSAVWLGGIPVIGGLYNKLIRKAGYSPEVNIALFKEDNVQGIVRNMNNKLFKQKAPEAVADLVKANLKRPAFERMAAGKFAATTFIPMALMGWAFPKLIFDSTAKTLNKQQAVQAQTAQRIKDDIVKFKGNISFEDAGVNERAASSADVSFGGAAAWLANRSNLERMFIMDAGYGAGSVSTERTKEARMELGFKYLGMMFLNFIAPGFIIEPLLDGLTGTHLDPVMLADKDFLEQVKKGTFKLPKKSDTPEADAKALLSFIDNPSNLNTPFVKFANRLKKITMLEKDKKLVVRDPRAYVDTKKLGKFRDTIKAFVDKAGALNPQDFDKTVKRMKGAKYFNILANIGLSSFLLAYCLPKVQFAFREMVTGSSLEPGIAGTAMKKGVVV